MSIASISAGMSLLRVAYPPARDALRRGGPYMWLHQNSTFREPENSLGIEYCPCTIVLSFEIR
jgi:hypothetical protein